MLKRLLEPVEIKGVKLRNRIVMTAMHLNYTPDGRVNDRLIAFYEERARGGAGLIVVGGCIIDDYAGAPWLIDIRTDDTVEGHSILAKALKQHGAAVACQLYHAGRYVHSVSIGGQQAIAPSAVASRFTNETPREMTRAEISDVVRHYADAAARVKQAGYDCVEVLAAAGYIIPQFLSPVTNMRTDEYGGSWENRLRFGLEVADAVREAVGPDYFVSFRIAGHDFMEGGNTNQEAALFAAELEKHGVDLINVTGGWHETRIPQLPMSLPRGGLSYLAAGVKKKVGLPVVSCNRINDVFVADEILRMGMADLIGMARGLIADPYLPSKAASGHFDQVSHCIACNQGCFDHVMYLKPVTCTINPRAGRELELPLTMARVTKRVAVVGGGPAGMKAAVTAANRGHRVTLFEKTEGLGGQLNLAAVPPGREEFWTAIEDLDSQLEEEGVEVLLDTEVTAEMLSDGDFDVIIIAAGGRPVVPPIPGVDLPHVIMAWDVLEGKADPTGEKVVIVGGGAVGAETAMYVAGMGTISGDTLQFLLLNKGETIETLEQLSSRGVKDVTVVEMLPKICRDVGISTRWTLLQDMRNLGIEMIRNAPARRIEAGGVVIEADGEEKLLPADVVIIAAGTCPENDLYRELKDSGPQVFLIGDAREARKAFEAIREGLETALEI